MINMADRHLVSVESGQETKLRIDHQVGRPLQGHVRGLEDVELAYAHVTIRGLGPEEGPGPNGKPIRQFTNFDMVSVDAKGDFTSDPIPPGKYQADLAATGCVGDTENLQPDFTGHVEFIVAGSDESKPIELVAKANRNAAVADDQKSLLRVIDADGQPVPRFEVSISSTDTNAGRFIAGRNGQIAPAAPSGCTRSLLEMRSPRSTSSCGQRVSPRASGPSRAPSGRNSGRAKSRSP